MGALRSFLAVCLGTLLLLSVTPYALADQGAGEELQLGEGPLGYVAEEDRLVVNNGNVTVWFQEYKPMVHIYVTDENGSAFGFTVAIKGVYELDASGMPVALLDLHRAYPIENMVSDGLFNYTSGVLVQYSQETQTVDVEFTLTASEFLVWGAGFNSSHVPALDGSGRQYEVVGQATVSVTFHISAMTGYVKFDLAVEQWTWANESGDSLALMLTIDGHEITDTFGQRPTIDGELVGNNRGADTQIRYTVHNTYYRDSVRVLGYGLIDEGYLTWADTALVTYGNTTTADVSVSTYMFNCSNNNTAAAHLLFTFAVPEGWNTNYSTLQYDPVIGTGELEAVSGSAGPPDQMNSNGGNPIWYQSGWLIALIAVAAAVTIAAAVGVLLTRKS